MSGGCPILTYHSQLIFGMGYADNSHVALEQDLACLARSGRRLVPLGALVEAWLAGIAIDFSRLACLTFDDGADFDWLDHDHPRFGPQPAFATLLRRHAADTGQWAGAVSFVIASDTARRRIGACELGADRLRADWWLEAQREGTLAIESHGWDHRHPAVAAGAKSTFLDVDDEPACRLQLDQASTLISARIDGRRPALFAYPYGEASDYLRRDYLPRRHAALGLRAACGTRAAAMHAHAPRWDLPRFVHAQHWRTPEDFEALLRAA